MTINSSKLLDGLTTILLALPSVILIFGCPIEEYAPPEYLAVLMLFLAVISQLAANERSKFALDTIKKWKYFDYLTTFFLAVYPFIAGYEDQLLAQLPPGWKVLGLVFFAGLSQWAANKRIQNAEPITATLTPSELITNTTPTITPEVEDELVAEDESEPAKDKKDGA